MGKREVKVTYHYVLWRTGRFGSLTQAQAVAAKEHFGAAITVTRRTTIVEHL